MFYFLLQRKTFYFKVNLNISSYLQCFTQCVLPELKEDFRREGRVFYFGLFYVV